MAGLRTGRYEMVPVAELVPYDGNAKRHTREQIDAVKASMGRLGDGGGEQAAGREARG